mmetsp:Transcript_6149/g.10220  ORF Transcript_6149/g.10220 Transcript_6149/m.10220 type:complete len:265 (-) Transcript_6149:342-1136(-)
MIFLNNSLITMAKSCDTTASSQYTVRDPSITKQAFAIGSLASLQGLDLTVVVPLLPSLFKMPTVFKKFIIFVVWLLVVVFKTSSVRFLSTTALKTSRNFFVCGSIVSLVTAKVVFASSTTVAFVSSTVAVFVVSTVVSFLIVTIVSVVAFASSTVASISFRTVSFTTLVSFTVVSVCSVAGGIIISSPLVSLFLRTTSIGRVLNPTIPSIEVEALSLLQEAGNSSISTNLAKEISRAGKMTSDTSSSCCNDNDDTACTSKTSNS